MRNGRYPHFGLVTWFGHWRRVRENIETGRRLDCGWRGPVFLRFAALAEATTCNRGTTLPARQPAYGSSTSGSRTE